MLLLEGQVCECEADKHFCTQCGAMLAEGHHCECQEQHPQPAIPTPPAIPEAIPFLEPEPAPFIEPTPQPTTYEDEEEPTYNIDYDPDEEPEPEPIKKPKQHKKRQKYVEKPTILESTKSNMEIPQEIALQDDTDNSIIACGITPMATEVAVCKYHIANMRNMFRITRGHGHIEVTNKRLIFRACKQPNNTKITVLREVNINEITGIETTNSKRFSPLRLGVGLFTVFMAASVIVLAALAFTDLSVVTPVSTAPLSTSEFFRWSFAWFINGTSISISQTSLIIGLTIGFGGAALFFILKGMLWLKLALVGASLGGFFAAALTTNLYAYVLLGIALVISVLGLALFSVIADLCISVHMRSGSDIMLVCAKRASAAFFQGQSHSSMGYAEIAPATDTEEAICELGAIIQDIQTRGEA